MSALDDFVNGENGQAEACLMDINVTPDKYTAIEDAIYRIRNHEHTFGAMSAENLASLMEKELLALRTRIAELENPWQPIETAPENTRLIVLGRRTTTCFIDFVHKEPQYDFYSHWMPLPKPPEEK